MNTQLIILVLQLFIFVMIVGSTLLSTRTVNNLLAIIRTQSDTIMELNVKIDLLNQRLRVLEGHRAPINYQRFAPDD